MRNPIVASDKAFRSHCQQHRSRYEDAPVWQGLPPLKCNVAKQMDSIQPYFSAAKVVYKGHEKKMRGKALYKHF
jgi:hypothetical protein